MKFRSATLWFLLLGAVAAAPARGDSPRAWRTYYETLSLHGEWLVSSNFERVWRPDPREVGPDFVPYATGGHWEHNGSDWVFESVWSWGWLPFHYGLWDLDDRDGWVWIPDDIWAPAWVTWRFGGGYVGWAPVPPANHPVVSWFFVATRHFAAPLVWLNRATGEDEKAAIEATRASSSVAAPGAPAWGHGPAIEDFRWEPR